MLADANHLAASESADRARYTQLSRFKKTETDRLARNSPVC
jgi:hypothetical protein